MKSLLCIFHTAFSSQLIWNIPTTCACRLCDLSKPVNKVSDSSHRIVTLHILIVSLNHDAGPVQVSNFHFQMIPMIVAHNLGILSLYLKLYLITENIEILQWHTCMMLVNAWTFTVLALLKG